MAGSLWRFYLSELHTLIIPQVVSYGSRVSYLGALVPMEVSGAVSRDSLSEPAVCSVVFLVSESKKSVWLFCLFSFYLLAWMGKSTLPYMPDPEMKTSLTIDFSINFIKQCMRSK